MAEDSEPKPAAFPPEWVKSLLKDGKAMVAFAAALLYAIARIATDAFYRSFGLSPDDVGVSRTATVSRAAITLVLFASVVSASVALPLAFVMRLGKLVPKRTGRGHHSHDSPWAATAWGAFGLVAILPAALAVLSPEFLDFLLGFNANDNGYLPKFARLSVGAWTAALCILLYLAMHASCASVKHLDAGKLRSASFGMFVPYGFLLVYAIAERPPQRHGWVQTADIVLVSLLLAVPVALIGWYLVCRKGITEDQRGSVAAVSASLAFYLLLLPLAVAVLSVSYLQRLFPGDASLWVNSDSPYAKHVGLALHLFWLVPWIALVAWAAWVAWRLGTCAPEKCAEPVQAVRFALVGLLALLSSALLVLADHRGDILAQRVEIGDRLRPWASALVVSAEPVCVTGSGAPDYPGPYMYVGKTGDRLVLVVPRNVGEVGKHQTAYVKAADARLTTIDSDVIAKNDRLAAVETCAGIKGPP